MTNQELIALALRFTANLPQTFCNTMSLELKTREEHDHIRGRLIILSSIVSEDWVALMEIIREVKKSQRIYSTIADRMDLNDEEMDRLINLARMLQEE